MKILKHGKVMLVKLDCPYCGCEFTCDPLTEIKAEQVIEYKADCGFLYTEEYVGCPCCGKRFRGDFDELPEYKGELTQSDLERMASLVYDAPQGVRFGGDFGVTLCDLVTELRSYLASDAAAIDDEQSPVWDGDTARTGIFMTRRAKEAVLDTIDAIPAADVAPVRRGAWEGTADGYADGELVYDMWNCSECGFDADGAEEKPVWKFCPNCGARMDGGADNG